MKSGTPGLRANPRTGGARDGRVFRPAGRHAGAAAGSDDLVLGSVARSTESLRVADYAACCRLVARESEAMLDDPEAAYPVTTEPEPVRHCDCCRWGQTCRAQWRREDDLALAANLTSRQRRAQAGRPWPNHDQRSRLHRAQRPAGLGLQTQRLASRHHLVRRLLFARQPGGQGAQHAPMPASSVVVQPSTGSSSAEVDETHARVIWVCDTAAHPMQRSVGEEDRRIRGGPTQTRIQGQARDRHRR